MDTIMTCRFCSFELHFTLAATYAGEVTRWVQPRSMRPQSDERVIDKHCPACGLVYTLADEEVNNG